MVAYLTNPAVRPRTAKRIYPGAFRGGFFGNADPLAAAFDLANQQAITETGSRYLDTIGGEQALRDRVVGQYKDYGKSTINDINTQYDTSLKTQLSDLASRGLSGSSLRSSVSNANSRERAAALLRAKDDILQQQVGQDVNLSNNLYGTMERKTDVQPNFAQLMQLSQQLGANGLSGVRGAGAGSRIPASSYFGGIGPRPPQYSGDSGYGYPASTQGPESRGWRPGLGYAPDAGLYAPYQAVVATPQGLDDVAGAATNRYNQMQQQNAAADGYFGGGGSAPFGQAINNGAHYIPRQPVAPAPVTQQGNPGRFAVSRNADQLLSTPDNQIFNPQVTQRLGLDPLAYSNTRVVQGADTAGANSIYANPVTGMAGQFSTYDTGGDYVNPQAPAMSYFGPLPNNYQSKMHDRLTQLRQAAGRINMQNADRNRMRRETFTNAGEAFRRGLGFFY